jgi:hypothetical protein
MIWQLLVCSGSIATNVPSIAAVAELELQNLKIYTNVK